MAKATAADFITVPGDELGRTWLNPDSNQPITLFLEGDALHEEIKFAGHRGLCATCKHGTYSDDGDVECELLPYVEHEHLHGFSPIMWPPGYEHNEPVLIRCEKRKAV